MNSYNDILGVINCFPNTFGRQASGYDLFIFGIGSFFVIVVLLWYYGRINKRNIHLSEFQLNDSVDQKKDILLYPNSNHSNFTISQTTSSTLVKVIVYVLIVFIATTPLYQLLGIE